MVSEYSIRSANPLLTVEPFHRRPRVEVEPRESLIPRVEHELIRPGVVRVRSREIRLAAHMGATA